MPRITTQPKKNITKLSRYRAISGNNVRKAYQNVILDKAPILPKPLEYSDIDNAVFSFVEDKIDLSIDGKLVPTYTLYSNQRFSEYSQMWEHTDENGNLYLNFKTVNRDKNPAFGGNQGNLWNIPGDRKYEILRRNIIDDNGTEFVEIYTMKQPFATDLTYTINFIATTVDNLNKFNQKINKLFASRQCYIRPNGHFVPMIIEEISDETSYSISDRKFYVQSVTIKLMAYIIEKEDFDVVRYPKRTNIALQGDSAHKNDNACVEIEEFDNPLKNTTINVNIQFKAYCTKTEFNFDTEMVVEHVCTKNVRNVKVMINDELFYVSKTFKIHDGDNIRVQITPIEVDSECVVQFIGYNPLETYNPNDVPELVYEEKPTHEEINVE